MAEVKRKLTGAMMSHIEETAQRLKYGKIIIELNEHLNTVDITTEVKNRFTKEE